MDTRDEPSSAADRTSQVIAGAVILSLGLLLLADRYLDRDVPLVRAWWPFLLLVLGAIRLAGGSIGRHSRRRSRRSGVWLVMVGCWAVVSEARLFGFTYATSWPLLVTGVGMLLVWRALSQDDAGAAGGPDDPGVGATGHPRALNAAGRRHRGCRAPRLHSRVRERFTARPPEASMRTEP